MSESGGHLHGIESQRGVAQLVARVLWVLSATAAGGESRESEKA